MSLWHRSVLTALLVLSLAAMAAAAELIPIAELRPGAFVIVRGEVVRVTDEDEFRLRDGSGSVLVYTGWRNPMPVREGDTVTVEGVVDNDLTTAFRPEIYAHAIVRADGGRVELRGD